MPAQENRRENLAATAALSTYTPRTSIHWKVLRQSVLLVSFCILLLGGLSFSIITSFLTLLQMNVGVVLNDQQTLGFTILILSGLLLILAFFLSTLLARGLTSSLQELSAKVSALHPGTWSFTRTIDTGDEVEALDRVVDELTRRLRDAYEHLEDKVKERTRQLGEEYTLDRAILESIEYGVFTVDASGIITNANPAACHLLDLPHEELIGVSGAGVLCLAQHNHHGHAEQHPITSVLRTGKSYRPHPSSHVSVQRKNGTLLPITLLVAPLIFGHRLFGAIVVLQDQTLERQIDYMKSEFISLASHQLRTPLSSIRWYIEMLSQEKGEFSSEHQSYLQEVDTATKRMASLINALLHVSRLEEGGLVVEKQQVDLTSFLHRLLQGWEAAGREQGIPVENTVSIGPSVSIHTDPILLEIVLQNLFTNAVKYSSAKKPITIACVIQDKHLRVAVRDQGIGIPQAAQKRIFEKFFRAKNVREIDTDGTGLGLYMSKRIIENLGGSLSFESEEGKGSEFTVSLPV